MSVFRGVNPFDQLTPGVKKILIANVVVFFLQIIFPDVLTPYLGLLPRAVMTKFWVWQIVTYAFLHGNGWHLFFNMFSLWMVGPHVEGMWGTKRFFQFYFLCAIGAALTQFLLAPDSLVVGASGAIYGLLIAFGLLFPDSVIYLFFVFPLRAIQAVIFIAALTLVSALGDGGSRIAHFAHLGGMLTGFLYFKLPEWGRSFRSRQGSGPFSGKRKRPAFEVISPDDQNDLKSEVDRILEKISMHGVDSLTKDEHATMQKYAKRSQ